MWPIRRRSHAGRPNASADRSEPQQFREARLTELLPRGEVADATVLARLRGVVHPAFYAAQVGEPALAGDVEATLDHYLEVGVDGGARVSVFFAGDHYRSAAGERGLPIPDDVRPFFHWLTVGWRERVVPTPLFDEAYYCAQHPELAAGREWVFAQFLRAGCYAPHRQPHPFSSAYGFTAAADARARQDPVALPGMLLHAEAYDLRRTSWLEAGVATGMDKVAALRSDTMGPLVAAAAALEPLVMQPKTDRWACWMPHAHRMTHVTVAAERVRRRVGPADVDTIVLTGGDQVADGAVDGLVEALRAATPGRRVLVVATEPDGSSAPTTDGDVLDLWQEIEHLGESARMLVLLDLVRGVRPERLVVAGSDLGWQMLVAFARTLRNEMRLGAVLGSPTPDADGDPVGHSTRELQACLDQLHWMAAPQRLRIELIDRYLLTGASRDRLVDIDDLDVTGLLGQAPARPTAAPMPASQPTIGRATSGATARSEGPTIAAVLTAHAEGALAGISLHSMLEAIGRAREIGLDVEALAVLDNPTAATREVFAEADQHGLRVEEVAYADQGLVRNHAAQMVGATHLAFLDGDDLWSRNWLVEAYRSCAEDPWAIGHPEVNWFFDNQHNLYFLPDQSDPAFDPATLRVANPWDALAFAPRAAHLEHPYSRRAVDDGYAYEDWHWNLETFGGGYRHRVVPGTIHFKRRRRDSQFVRARAQQVLTRPSEQLSYSWWAEPEDASRSAIRRMPAQSRSGSSSRGR